ncbi:hypothetical protein D3C80_1584700 [compost metagenome]
MVVTEQRQRGIEPPVIELALDTDFVVAACDRLDRRPTDTNRALWNEHIGIADVGRPLGCQCVDQACIGCDHAVIGLWATGVVAEDVALVDLSLVVVLVPAGAPAQDQGQRVGQLDAPCAVNALLLDLVLAIGTRTTGCDAVVIFIRKVVVEVEYVRP